MGKLQTAGHPLLGKRRFSGLTIETGSHSTGHLRRAEYVRSFAMAVDYEATLSRVWHPSALIRATLAVDHFFADLGAA
jgi:hypothetical protein